MNVTFRLVDGVEWVAISFDLNEVDRVATPEDRMKYPGPYADFKAVGAAPPSAHVATPEHETKSQPFFGVKKKTK